MFLILIIYKFQNSFIVLKFIADFLPHYRLCYEILSNIFYKNILLNIIFLIDLRNKINLTVKNFKRTFINDFFK